MTMQAPRDGDAQQTVLGPKVEPKKPPATPHDNWAHIPAHPGWLQHPATRAVKRSDQ
jgi:hypothetical protein